MTGVDKHHSRPADFLVENIALLPTGRALDIAMGEGRNAVFLAGRGFTVDGVDISPETVARAGEAARAAGVTINARVADLEGGYEIRENVYDLIICFNYLQRSLIPAIKKGVRPGGAVVYETYTIDQLQFGHPRNPDYLLGHNELLDMFRDFHCMLYHEGITGENKAVAGIIARKP